MNTLASVKFTTLSCGDYHTACLDSEGFLYSWGGSQNSKLLARPSIKAQAIDLEELNNTLSRKSNDTSGGGAQSILRPLKDKRIQMVTCGDFHTLALDLNGKVWSWGGGGQA